MGDKFSCQPKSRNSWIWKFIVSQRDSNVCGGLWCVGDRSKIPIDYKLWFPIKSGISTAERNHIEKVADVINPKRLKPINGNQTLSINYLMILRPNKSFACQVQEYLTPWTRSFRLSQCMVGTRSVKAMRS
jgi:hypothetical protein